MTQLNTKKPPKEMEVSPIVFEREFNRFKTLIRDNVGEEFTNFREGFAAEWEAYKEHVRNEALRRLDMPAWTSADVGTGNILKRVIDAIEIQSGQLRNNLVAWQNRYGHNARAHSKLLDAQADVQSRRKFETWFLDFSRGARFDGDLFEEFRELAGSRYDLLAYLFFLKDWEQYMPIATTSFDAAFRQLEVPLRTKQKCSWENYQQFNDALRDVQQHLQKLEGLEDARLIDAHSFCWILIRLPDEAQR